ncbi:MurR/RpiR family transcriptional regulator [Chloroflexota bacterium]
MNYEERIREARPRMSKSFSRLADYILDSYVQAALMTATELAHQVDVDAATVVRFAQKLGYSGFPELQDNIKERVKQDLLIRPEQAADPDSIPGVVSGTLHRLQEAIEQARMLLDANAVAELVGQIGKARRIIIAPEGLGQAAAYNLATLLEQGGFLVSQTQPGLTDLARTISSAANDDLLLAIDVTGDAPFIARALAEANAMNIQTAAIVGAASHQSANEAGVVLAAQNQPDLNIAIVVVDAIVYALAEALRWQYQDRFEGADEAVEALFERIQVGDR